MKKVITEEIIKGFVRQGRRTIPVGKNDIITPLALDAIRDHNMSIVSLTEENTEKKTAQSVTEWKNIAIGSDHTGLQIKTLLTEILRTKGYTIDDRGTYSKDSCDFPDFAIEVGKAVALKQVDFGIIVDATGIPSAITANKFPGIRAATCYNEFSTRSARSHNNANILVVGAKSLGEETIKSILNVWLETEFEGGRHQKRLDKISELEKHFLAKNK